MLKGLIFVAGALLLATAGLYGFRYLGGERTASTDELARLALTAPSPQARELAALELAGRGAGALPQMRRVLAESDAPVVRAAMIQALGAQYDFESMPQLLPALED